MEQMLVELFGSGWVNLLEAGSEEHPVGAILGVLFGFFNAAVALVTVAVLFVLAAAAIGDTAQTGQISSGSGTLWVPVRAVLAAALLVPIVKGYSLLQVLILALVVNFSLTLANSMAVEAAKFLASGEGTLQDPIATQVTGVAEQVLYSSVCELYYNTIEYSPSQGAQGKIIAQVSQETVNNLYQTRWSFNGDDYSGQGEAACGAYIISCPHTDPDTLIQCDEQFDALKHLKQELNVIAHQLIADEPVDTLAIAQASINYQARLQTALHKRVSAAAVSEQIGTAQEELVQSIEENGFAFLGQWYMTLAAINQRSMRFAQATLDTLPIDQSKAVEHELGFASYYRRTRAVLRMKARALEQTTGQLSQQAMRQRQIAGLLGGEGTLGDYLAKYSSLNPGSGDLPNKTIFDFQSDPLTGLQQLGSTMVTLTTNYWSRSRIKGTVAAPNEQDQQVLLLVGKASSTLSNVRQDGVGAQIDTFASYIMIILFLAGLTLMYYVPAVPFILWTFGVVGYLVLVLESLIAAPLWAASHALPRGSGLTSDASRQGYILLLNLAIRPPLMVVGLIGGGALMFVATQFAMATFDIYSASLLETRVQTSTLLTFAALFIVEVVILIGLIHKSFALIYEASDKAVEGVTGQSRTNGEAGDESRASASTGAAQRSGEAALGRASYANKAASSSGDPAANQKLR